MTTEGARKTGVAGLASGQCKSHSPSGSSRSPMRSSRAARGPLTATTAWTMLEPRLTSAPASSRSCAVASRPAPAAYSSGVACSKTVVVVVDVDVVVDDDEEDDADRVRRRSCPALGSAAPQVRRP